MRLSDHTHSVRCAADTARIYVYMPRRKRDHIAEGRIFTVMPLIRTVMQSSALALLAIAVAATPLFAQTLDRRVVDEAGVMSDGQVAEAEADIGTLEDAENVQLWVLFVDSTGGQPITEFADAVAAENGLGGNDALLAVAVDDRRDAMWVGDLLDEASDEEIDRILADDVEPRLADGDWVAAGR